MTDESLLISRALEGDQSAFKALYDRHVDSLFRFLSQFTRDRHEVKDWVQRSFIKAYESLAGFERQSRFSTWLFAIGLNQMRSDRRRAALLPFESLEHHEPVEDDSADRFEWDEMMKSLMEQLTETQKAVFLLHEVEGFSHAEIAGMLDVGESTSRTVLSRAKHWLRTQWERERKAAG
jgi:RNA polymerase sigma-70 factor (ECF subfamily)